MAKPALSLSKYASRALDLVEKTGNALPHPATLFALFAASVAAVSALCAWLGVQAIHPTTSAIVLTRNLLDLDGLRWIYTSLTKNFVDFPPLGLVLVAMIGIGLAEGSGLLSALIKAVVISSPKKLITSTIVFAGILSHIASEAGYVILIPLGAAIFHALGRHPLAGLAAAFCGVSGGFGANFLIGSVDPVLAGLTQSAAQMLDPTITISPVVNYYFMVASGVLVVIIGTFITEKIVEPRLGNYKGGTTPIVIDTITKDEKRGLRNAGLSVLASIIVILLLTVPDNALLRDPETKSLLRSPFFDGLITAVMIFFFVPGLVYGITVKTIRSDKEAVKHIVHSMSGLAGYIVLVFFAAQFVYFFRHSNLGVILAINGAELLRSIGLTGIPLIIIFVLFSAFINMFMGSASAKWAIMAPVFVPMFMLLDYHPGLTQAAFRVGDSVTNIITPMMSYFALIVAFAQKYDEKYGLGTIIAMMLPYSVSLMIFWVLLLVAWIFLGLPVGPDGFLYLNR